MVTSQHSGIKRAGSEPSSAFQSSRISAYKFVKGRIRKKGRLCSDGLTDNLFGIASVIISERQPSSILSEGGLGSSAAGPLSGLPILR